MVESKQKKTIKILRIISFVLLFIVVTWLSLTLFELYRVKKDNKPIICMNETKEVEDDDEYSVTCYGFLYKYREYFYIEDNKLSAKEFSLMFKDFHRNGE